MSNEDDLAIARTSSASSILLLLSAIPAIGLALYALVGPIVAAVVCALYAVALGLTILAERTEVTASRDPATGLPDRTAAIARLAQIFEQKLAGSSQAGVFVIRLENLEPGTSEESHQPILVMAIARLAQGLRRGDRIIYIGGNSLAAILGPSRGLTARAAEGILGRIEGMFSEPLRIGTQILPIDVSVGACLQHDAPRADAQSWLEAAELAAVLAAEEREARLFPSGATKVDRSAWEEHDWMPAIGPEGDDEIAWKEAGRRRDVDPAEAHFDDRRRSA